MLRGLTRAGLGDVGSDQRLIELAAQYGFDAVDLDAKGFVSEYGVERAKELLQVNNIKLGSIGLPVEWRSTDEVFRNGLKALAESAAAAADLGCTACCTYILPSTDLQPAHFMALAVKRLRICAQLLDGFGIKLGLEFVGPHHLRTRWKHPFIWTQEETLDLIAAIGTPNAGLLFDAYHWYTNGQDAADIAKLEPSQIVHVHINDAPDVPMEQALDNGRLYPGEGVIDLAGFLRGLQEIGYDGIVAQEILTAAKPTEAAEQLVQRSKTGFDKVFAEAGI